MKIIFLFLLILASPLYAQDLAPEHDFAGGGKSSGGEGIKSEKCLPCHIPKTESKKGFWEYSEGFQKKETPAWKKPAAIDRVSPPVGITKLCVSCHDNVLAKGYDEVSEELENQGAKSKYPKEKPIWLDHLKSHPVGFIYDQFALLSIKARRGEDYRIQGKGLVKLDSENRAHCTMCHDPHLSKDKKTNLKLWRTGPTDKGNAFDSVCLECHPQ